MELLFITWNPDPEIFSIGFVTVRWYGILFALPFFAGYYVMQWMYKRENQPVKELDTLLTYLVIGTIAGARLGHCLFYEPEKYLPNPLEILKIWEGGLASHGAALGVLLALVLFSRKTGRGFWWITDRLAVLAGFAGACIRAGNLMNSEIVGRPTELPWGFVFVQYDAVPRHPGQLYEAIAYIIIFVFMFLLYRKHAHNLKTGYLTGLLFALVFGIRFLVEFLKEPQVGFESGMALNMGQLLSLPFIAAGLWLMLRKNTERIHH